MTKPTVNQPDEPALLLTIDTAAKLLSVGRTTVFSLLRTGQLDSLTIGRRHQGFEGDLDQGFQGAVPAMVFLSFLRCANTRATDT